MLILMKMIFIINKFYIKNYKFDFFIEIIDYKNSLSK